ncbi:hypothetical protein PENANT_c080G03866, partial [Penicillium antarcticum]
MQRTEYARTSVDDSDEDTIILDLSGAGQGNASGFSNNDHGTTGSAVQSFVPLVDLTISTTSSPTQLPTSPVYALINTIDIKRTSPLPSLEVAAKNIAGYEATSPFGKHTASAVETAQI